MQTSGVQVTAANPVSEIARKALRQSLRAASRSRTTCQFMAWTYVLSQTYSHDGFFSNGWHSHHSQDADTDPNAHVAMDSHASAFDPQGELLQIAASGDVTDDDGSSFSPQFHGEPTFYATIGAGGAPSSTLEGSASGEGGGAGHMLGSVPGSAAGSASLSYSFGGIAGGVASQPRFAPYDGPPITFFGGLSGYTDKLGFGLDPNDFVKTIASGFSAPTLGALGFAANPLEAIPVWQSFGQASTTMQLHAGDSAHVNWLVQADGYNSQGSAQLQGTNASSDNSTLVQTADLDSKTVGNTATLTEAHDPASALVVKGNYYEFNTIVQVNVVWNNDTINVLRTGDGTANVPSLIDTGDNAQQNTAQIVSAASVSSTASSDTGPNAHHVIVGGVDQHTAVIQASSLTEVDNLGFNFDDILQGNINVTSIPNFADVKAGGNVQGNSAEVWTGGQFGGSIVSVQKFLNDHASSTIEYVNGDYYNFNTIFQINLSSNSDTISKTIGDPSIPSIGSGQDGTGIIASGGNIQFNNATILKYDQGDDLFVGGKYTQYNMVLQLNVLETSSTIDQTSKVTHVGTSPIATIDDPLAASAHSYNNGSNGSSIQVAMPSHIDETTLRGGQTIDSTL